MIQGNLEELNGKRVVDLDEALATSGLGDLGVRLRCSYDEEETLPEKLLRLLQHPDIAALDTLVFGVWMKNGEAVDTSPRTAIELLVSQKHVMPGLAALFVGDIVSEENEISWILQDDMSPIWERSPS